MSNHNPTLKGAVASTVNPPKTQVVHNVPPEVDALVQTHATLGDKVGNTSAQLLELCIPYFPDAFRTTKAKDRKATDYKEWVKLALANMLADKSFQLRFKQAHWKAFDLKNEMQSGFELKTLTEDGSGTLRPTEAGQTVDLKLDAQTVMAYSSNDMTIMKSKKASDPKDALYDKYSDSRYEWLKPVRDEINSYSSGKTRDLRTSLTKALKRKLGVATNVASEPEIITVRIPNSLALIVKMRNLAVKNGHTFSASQTQDFEKGVALIEKSCK